MKTLLSHNEAAALGAFGRSREAFIPDLAVSARLTPTEVKEAVAGLRKKGLVKTFKSDRYVMITPAGRLARKNWAFEDQLHEGSSQGTHTSLPKYGADIDLELKKAINEL